MHVEGVFAEKLAAARGVTFLVAGAEVLTDEGSGESVLALELWTGCSYLWQSGKSQL